MKKNPWITPSQPSSGSEPGMVRTETEGCSAEERDDEKVQEVLERKGDLGVGRRECVGSAGGGLAEK